VSTFIVFCAIALVILSFASLWRAFVGPSVADRVAAINVVSIKVTTLILLLSVAFETTSYISVALVYAMIAFVATLGVAKYLTNGALD